MSLLRVARNVSHLGRVTDFYESLGFAPSGQPQADMALAALLGCARVDVQYLTLGEQVLELSACDPPGAAYPPGAPANARLFQHIALLVPDMEAAMARALSAGARPISHSGPVRLPPESGSAIAWKFRDPDSHPLEFLQHSGPPGYDHSAIVVTDSRASTAFYESLGLRLEKSQRNEGPAQARLDGFAGAAASISSLRGASGPGIELLNYEDVVSSPPPGMLDIAADRLVFHGARNDLLRDPDGHFVQLSTG